MTVKGEFETVAVRVPKKVVEMVDELIREGYYQNRSDFLRTAIRLLLRKHGR